MTERYGGEDKPEYRPRIFLQQVQPRGRFSVALGWISLGGTWVHEAGHWLAARCSKTLSPAILYLDVTRPPNGPIVEEEGYSGWSCYVSLLSAHAGRVIYAGSKDPRTGKIVPLPLGKRAFNAAEPGGVEVWASLGGPLLQLAYGCFLLAAALWVHAYWFPRRPYDGVPLIFYSASTIVLLLPSGVNFGRVFEALCPFEEGCKKSDGWYIRGAVVRRFRGGRGIGDAE